MGKTAKVIFAGAVVPSIIIGCTRKINKVVDVSKFFDLALDGPFLKAGLIGCGGRISGAAINFLDAVPNLQIVTLVDIFQDRVDAYQKVFDADVYIVLLSTP